MTHTYLYYIKITEYLENLRMVAKVTLITLRLFQFIDIDRDKKIWDKK